MEEYEASWPEGFHQPLKKSVRTMQACKKKTRTNSAEQFDVQNNLTQELYLLPRTYICSLGLIFAPWDLYLLSRTYICSLGLIFAPWDLYLLPGTYICSLGLIFAH